MHVHIGFMELVTFICYYIIVKAIILILNLEVRRNKLHVPAAVSGLLS